MPDSVVPLAAVPERSPLTAHVLALDGVRGLAIAAVLAFHFVAHGPGQAAWPGWLRGVALGGWAGVDLFFVLSGFLITRILLTLRGRPGALRLFYVRRALRIFPLYYAVLIAVVVAALVQGRGRLAAGEALNLAVVALYGTNFNIAARGWGVAVFQQVQLTHLWTLAIEEQFYLLWPFVVLLPARRVVAGACGVLVIGVPLLRWWMVRYGVDPTAVYVLTYCRADALAWGGLVALLEASAHGPRLARGAAALCLLGGAGIVAAAVAAGSVDEYGPAVQICGFTALPIAFAGGVGLCAAHALPRPLTAVLSAGALTRLGRYSYGIYLFHVPLRGVASWIWQRGLHRDPAALSLEQTVLTAALLTAVSIGLAALSFHVFESPLLRLKPQPRPGMS